MKRTHQPFARRPSDSVGAWGERELISRVQRWLGKVSPPSPFGIGDDCAVLPPSPQPQVITVDPVIYGRHFDASVPPAAVGAKLLKRNVSDVAAMGAWPTSAVLALTLDAGVSKDWLRRFYLGLAASAREFRIRIVGGDIAQGDGCLAASLTLVGHVAGPRALTRRGARLGDQLFVTGLLGGSLRSGHHVRFTPRLREGAWLARQTDVRAMMDVSDGLAKDVHALCPPQAQPVIQETALPRRRGSDTAAALTDGEDYELLFVLDRRTDPLEFERRWRRAFPLTRLSRLGYFMPRRADLPAGSVPLSRYHGYEHLR